MLKKCEGMEEGRGKYLEGMVQRAMEHERPAGERQRIEPPTQAKPDSRAQHVDKGSTAGNINTAGKSGTAGSGKRKGTDNESGGTAGRTGTAGKGKGSFFKGLISGTVISDSFILKDIRYSAMILILAVVFIANRFNAERLEREITALEQEVRDLRAESLSVSADLGSVSRQSEISDLVKERGLGLEELREPPYRIVVNE